MAEAVVTFLAACAFVLTGTFFLLGGPWHVAASRIRLGRWYMHDGYGLVRVREAGQFEVVAFDADGKQVEVGGPIQFLRQARLATGAEQLGMGGRDA